MEIGEFLILSREIEDFEETENSQCLNESRYDGSSVFLIIRNRDDDEDVPIDRDQSVSV